MILDKNKLAEIIIKSYKQVRYKNLDGYEEFKKSGSRIMLTDKVVSFKINNKDMKIPPTNEADEMAVTIWAYLKDELEK